MTVKDIVNCFVEPDYQMVRLYNLKNDSVIFEDRYRELEDELQDLEFMSIDNLDVDGIITFNVEVDIGEE